MKTPGKYTGERAPEEHGELFPREQRRVCEANSSGWEEHLSDHCRKNEALNPTQQPRGRWGSDSILYAESEMELAHAHTWVGGLFSSRINGEEFIPKPGILPASLFWGGGPVRSRIEEKEVALTPNKLSAKTINDPEN